MSADGGSKPKLRGVLHQWAAVFAGGAGMALVAMAPTPRAAAAAALYAVSLVVMFTTSAVYHRVNWSLPARARMRRMDHASIFILIAGTYTPIALIGLGEGRGDRLFVSIWCGAGIGVLQSVLWVRAPKVLGAALAVGVGWMLVPYFSDVQRSLGTLTLCLLLGGGLAYTLGAIAYAAKRPRLKPALFGYHELFHALTLVGAGVHFAAVVGILRLTRLQ